MKNESRQTVSILDFPLSGFWLKVAKATIKEHGYYNCDIEGIKYKFI